MGPSSIISSSQRGKNRSRNGSQSQYNVTIQLFSGLGSPYRFESVNNGYENDQETKDGVTRVKIGETISINISGLNSQQQNSGAFFYNFHASNNADNLLITGSSGNVISNQDYGSLLPNGPIANGSASFSETGSSFNFLVSKSATDQASSNGTYWNMTVDYYYLNPRPTTLTGYQQ